MHPCTLVQGQVHSYSLTKHTSAALLRENNASQHKQAVTSYTYIYILCIYVCMNLYFYMELDLGNREIIQFFSGSTCKCFVIDRMEWMNQSIKEHSRGEQKHKVRVDKQCSLNNKYSCFLIFTQSAGNRLQRSTAIPFAAFPFPTHLSHLSFLVFLFSSAKVMLSVITAIVVVRLHCIICHFSSVKYNQQSNTFRCLCYLLILYLFVCMYVSVLINMCVQPLDHIALLLFGVPFIILVV